MKNIIGVFLIILAVGLGYMGVKKVSNSGSSVEVIGIELSASDEGKKNNWFNLFRISSCKSYWRNYFDG